MKKIQKSLKEINWAWFFEEVSGQMKQFECTDCILIELCYHLFKKSNDQRVRFVPISMGKVDIQTMKMILEENP